MLWVKDAIEGGHFSPFTKQTLKETYQSMQHQERFLLDRFKKLTGKSYGNNISK